MPLRGSRPSITKEATTKSLVIISDMHCGSVHGLTPPEYFKTHRQSIQREAWDAYIAMTRKWAAPDILLVNGDSIDGTQSKQGGAELITSDRNVQCQMAVDAIKRWHAKTILMTYGSKYHVGEQAEDFEFNIAHQVGAKIEGRLYFDVEGMIIDARHKVGSSSIPHGRATPLIREMMWNLMKAAEDVGPHVNMVIRSHVHYHLWIEQPNRIMFTTPALQLSRGRYGARECVGETHWGAIRLMIDKKQIVGKDIATWSLHGNKAKVIRIR